MGKDKRKNVILKQLIEDMSASIYEQEGTIEFIIEDAVKDIVKENDEGEYVFDIYELKTFTSNILNQCETFITSFIDKEV